MDSITGGFEASAKYACPWCQKPSSLYDKTYDELKTIAQDRRKKVLSLTELDGRPPIANLLGRPSIPQIQRENTFNIFHLDRGGTHLHLPTNIVPPSLNIHIGLVKKVVKALDGIISVWNQKMNHTSEDHSPADELLAFALSRCGARRENYYSGQLSSGPCTKLMKQMPKFCALFFKRKAKE